MAWVRIDDRLPEHPKLARAGDLAPLCGWLFTCGLSYCNRWLTDGFIPHGQVPRLVVLTGGLSIGGQPVTIDDLVRALVDVGMWEARPDGYQVHDYLVYQPSREKVTADTDQRREAGRESARRRWHPNGPPNGPLNGSSSSSLPLVPDGPLNGPLDESLSAPLTGRSTEGVTKSCSNPNPKPSTREGEGVQGESPADDPAGAFWHTWRGLLHELAGQTPPLTPRPAEFAWCVKLVARYPDPAQLEALTREYLTSPDREIRKTARSLGMLHHWIGEIESRLHAPPDEPASRRAVHIPADILRHARRVRSEAYFGRCPHDPPCPDSRACLRAICLDLMGEPAEAQAAETGASP